MRSRNAVQIAGAGLAVALFGLTLVLALTVHNVSPIELRRWELAGAVLGVLLWGGAVSMTMLAVRTLWRCAHDGGHAPDDLSVAWNDLWTSCYRLAGKTMLTAAVLLIYLSRNGDVLRWLRVHPLALFLLLLDCMATFTILDARELLWRSAFRDGR